MTTINAMKKIELAIDEIDKAISNEASFSSFTTVNQLAKFKKEFMRAKHLIESKNVPDKSQRHLGISRVIVEQWPLDSELGCIIINAESAYSNI